MFKITIYDEEGHIEDDFIIEDLDEDFIHSVKQELEIGNMFLVEIAPKDEIDDESRIRPFD